MTAAIFGLIGGLLTSVYQYLLGVRNEYGAATAAARLVTVELDALIAEAERGRSGKTPAWDRQQAALALVLPDDHWTVVATA